MTAEQNTVLPFKISVLVFLQNHEGKELLICRRKSPNQGCWSPIGGKLIMSLGESPYECAIREIDEEVGLSVTQADLHLFSIVSEKAYEGSGHWLMFLYKCRKTLPGLPDAMEEGHFGFFSREQIDRLAIPETDRLALWPVYDDHSDGFVALRADCSPGRSPVITLEEIISSGRDASVQARPFPK
jgi:8-oxo-dGTP diphosphatase